MPIHASRQPLNRQEALFWGEFVRIATKMYIPGVTNPAIPEDFPVGWELIRMANLESAVGFIRQREFIGFLAQSLNHPSQFALVLHGSLSVLDFIDDMEFQLTDFKAVPGAGKTEYGFTRLYESIFFVDPLSSTAENLQAVLSDLNQVTSFTVAGHSLGSALGILQSVVLANLHIPVEVYAFAPPMVGDPAFVAAYGSLVKHSHIVINTPDVVPKLPGRCLGYKQVPTAYRINTLNFPAIKRNLICFHSLDAYLYSLGKVDGHLGSCRA